MDKEVVELYLDDIIPNRFQPREVFNEEALQELATSIKEHGVIQPIIVRKIGDKYEIIAGERRYKASVIAGLTKIPAIIRNLDDKEASKVALLENLQRKDLTAIEEARTYQKILELDSMTQEELGRTMGKSQAAIANKMRLLSLPDEIQEALLMDRISERHARSLLNLNSSQEQIQMLNEIVEKRMTVRELDNKIREIKGEDPIPESVNSDSISIRENNTSTVESSLKDTYDFDFPKLETLEILSDEEDDNNGSNDGNDNLNPIPNESIINKEDNIFKQPETDMKTIEDLLRHVEPKSYKLKDALQDIRNTTERLKNKGFDVKVEEMDFENTYQVVIRIEKDK